jgi:hypothetical protein
VSHGRRGEWDLWKISIQIYTFPHFVLLIFCIGTGHQTEMRCKKGFVADAPLCAVCEVGHFMQLRECSACEKPHTGAFVLFLFGGIVLVLTVLYLFHKYGCYLKHTSAVAHLKIVISFIMVIVTVEVSRSPV